MTLPAPAVSGAPDIRGLAIAADQAFVADDVRPADTGNLPGFLGVALRRDLEIDPEHSVETLQRFGQIETRADARRYLESVWAKLGPGELSVSES